MDYFPFMFMMLSVCLLMTILYLLEVLAGGSISMYDHESGAGAANGAPTKTTTGQFLGCVAPLQLAALGLPLAVYDLLAGGLLMSTSLLLFRLCRKQSPAGA